MSGFWWHGYKYRGCGWDGCLKTPDFFGFMLLIGLIFLGIMYICKLEDQRVLAKKKK